MNGRNSVIRAGNRVHNAPSQTSGGIRPREYERLSHSRSIRLKDKRERMKSKDLAVYAGRWRLTERDSCFQTRSSLL